MAIDASAQFRRSGQRDDRRRRLMTEDNLVGDDGSAGVSSQHRNVRHKSAHYGEAEFLESAPRLIDLVPRSLVAWLFVVLGGATLIVGLEALYASMPDFCPAGQTLAAFDLAVEGSLGTWFSSLLLLAAGFFALLIYGVRRHRSDDYRGRYRIWLAAAGCWLLLASDEAASLHEAMQAMLISASGSPLLGDGSIWWMLVYGLVIGAVGVRLVLDMRESRLALAALAAAAACVAIDVVVRLDAIFVESATHRVMAIEAAEMSAYLLLAVAMGLFARHVLLDAEGRLPQRQPKRKTSKKTEAKKAQKSAQKSAPVDTAADSADNGSDEAVDTSRREDLRHEAPRPTFATGRPVAADDELSDGQDDADDDSSAEQDNRKLSKSDRKALKRQLAEQRMQRQRQQQSQWK